MLPHLLHTTGRAVAVVQNQTHTIRNVLQLQSSGPSSGSGSSWGNGPGPGGAKYGAGSRFYAGYNSAGRAVTQANAVTSHDGQAAQNDEIEDITVTPSKRNVLSTTPRKTRRMRSSSVSMGVTDRTERGEKLGVLKTVQLHARGKHAFATGESMASAKERLLADDTTAELPTQSLIVRRNSTSAPLSPLLTPSEPPIPPPEATKAQKQAEKTPVLEQEQEHVQDQVQDEEDPPIDLSPRSPKPSKETRILLDSLSALAAKGDANAVAHTVRHMLKSSSPITVETFNAALSATIRARAPGEPIAQVIDLYHAMLKRSVLPNVQTYELLIQALVTRDAEIHRARVALETRTKHSPLDGRPESVSASQDQERMAELGKEDNFGSAMSLFESVLAVGGKDQLSPQTFVRLMSCAANHADVHSAIHVFAQLESRSSADLPIPIPVYRYLILTFSNAGQIEQAEEIFKAFVDAGKTNKLQRYPAHLSHVVRQTQIQVWNTMIEAYFRAGYPEKAVEVVDTILKSSAGNNFTIADVPVATSSTFTTVIHGFLAAGDVHSALAWFDKLLTQEATPRDPYEGLSGAVMRPDGLAWFLMLDNLAERGMVDDLNRLFRALKQYAVADGISIKQDMRRIVYTANLEQLSATKDTESAAERAIATENVKYLVHDLREMRDLVGGWWSKTQLALCKELAVRGEFELAIGTFHDEVLTQLGLHSTTTTPPQSPSPSPSSPGQVPTTAAHTRSALAERTRKFMRTVSHAVKQGRGELPFEQAIMLARLGWEMGVRIGEDVYFGRVLVHSYGLMRAKEEGRWKLEGGEWEVMFGWAVVVHANAKANDVEEIKGFAFRGLFALMDDFVAEGLAFDVLSEGMRVQIIDAMDAHHGSEKRREVLARCGTSYSEASEKYDQLQYIALQNAVAATADSFNPVESQVVPPVLPTLREDAYHSKAVATALGPTVGVLKPQALDAAYKRFEYGLKNGVGPSIHLLCRMIEGQGRTKGLDEVRELYTAAQAMLRNVARENQRYEWAAVEDSMIIALAHAGHVDAAHVHRVRILEQGLCPSADAYGILVQLVKDTTDDTSGAIALFQEAVQHGVKPNGYLYNNIISKLSKARKADYALELFQQMKASRVPPTSITFGAVIGACARVGDVGSAEALFKEMVKSHGFKPRVPPYNTMMQLYTTTKPNRTSALWYYEEMIKAGVRPTAHTYKLLLDAYGSLEPVALQPMEEVFEQLLNDPSVVVTGAHFASLINAYGCVSKDLDKAISVFESMGNDPRTPRPDAVAFEALINALVAHKRTDLFPVYIERMAQGGVHMTAYIANFLIKGYANVGNLSQAREIFESLANPPTGVAAPNNHAPHSPDMSVDVPVMAPVYREPSTWEAMVRAELGAGNREAAIMLLERLRERNYPEAVFNRISGILTDFSVPQ